MASNIISSTIDESYPVAGIDNDTQGFRDNFSIIKTGLSVASSELTNLQNDTAKLTTENDFNSTRLTDGTLHASTESFLAKSGIVDSQEVNFSEAMYQSLRFGQEAAGQTVQLTLAGFPTDGGRVARFRVQLFGPGTEEVVSVSFNALGGGVIKKSPRWPMVLEVDSAEDPIILEFWSYDGGNSVIYADYHGRFEV